MEEIMLKIENVSKSYRLGQIGGTTLRDELQRKRAKLRGEEDPTKKIGAKDFNKGETFMALNGVSFEVKKGERVGIIGHNGAGKSTLLKLISRVTAPSAGEIGLNGRVASMLEVGTGFHPELTGRENIYMNGAILGMSKKEIDEKMEDIIEFSECRQFIDTPVKRYSSGMYVKLAFSVAAHLDSEIMIMDEVLAVGDVNFQQKCLAKMKSVAEEDGRTILYVSHNMNTIKQLCSRCIVLSHGMIIYDGDVDEAIEHYVANNSYELQQDYDTEAVERKFETTGKCKISHIHIDEYEIEQGNNCCFQIMIRSALAVESSFIRMVLYNKRGAAVGTAYSEQFELHDGENTVLFELKTSNLAPDDYYTDLILCEYSDGVQIRHDILLMMMPFKVSEKEQILNMHWLTRSWGNYVIDKMSVRNLQ